MTWKEAARRFRRRWKLYRELLAETEQRERDLEAHAHQLHDDLADREATEALLTGALGIAQARRDAAIEAIRCEARDCGCWRRILDALEET